MSALFPSPSARAVNHVLRSAPLAMERLAKHAGRTAAIHVGPMMAALTLQTTGEVTAAVAGAPIDLVVRISPFLLPRLVAREAAAFDEIEMSGDRALADDIAFIARHLTWDVEEDLSKMVGDIAAHRLVAGARALHTWTLDAGLRTAQGAAEFWTEESPLITSRVKLAAFAEDVARFQADLDRLEQRLDK